MHTLLNQLSAGPYVVVDDAWSESTAGASIDKFCRSHGWDWGEVFFGPLPSTNGGAPALSLDDFDFLCSGDIERLAQDPLFPDAQKLICYTKVCINGGVGTCPTGCQTGICNLSPEVGFEVMAYMLTLQGERRDGWSEATAQAPYHKFAQLTTFCTSLRSSPLRFFSFHSLQSARSWPTARSEIASS